jgi:5,10-methylenetetrahydrofolate reductase
LQVLTQFFINVDVFRALRERLGGLEGVPLWGGSNRIEFPEALNRLCSEDRLERVSPAKAGRALT